MEGVPFAFLSKIFMDLEKGKLVSASYGANGGYILARSSGKIAVMDIVKLLENMNTVNCGACGKSKKCLTRNVWGKVDMAIGKTLGSITLADLIK
jgi:Rrf2 family protein